MESMMLQSLLIVSFLCNLGLVAFIFLFKKSAKIPQLTVSAEALLHDLTRGPAVVRIEVIDAKNLLLRRPRG